MNKKYTAGDDLGKFFGEMEKQARIDFVNSGAVVACNYECNKIPSYTGCGHRNVCPGPDYMRTKHAERKASTHVAGSGVSQRAKEILHAGINC